jgi:drug/metabolite transporter (DMT)-like permease
MPSAADTALQRRAERRSALLPWVALGSVYILWGSTYTAISVAVEHGPPFFMAGVRYLIAGALLYPFARRGAVRPTRGHWAWAALVACSMLVGGNGLVSVGEQTVPSGIASLLIATVPLWLLLIDLASGGRRVGLAAAVGLVAGFGGIAVLVRPGGGWDAGGAAVIVAAAVFWALGSAFSRSPGLPPRPLLATAMESLVAGAVMFAIAGVAGEWGDVTRDALDPAAVFSVAWLAVPGTIVALTAYTYALRTLPTPTVSTYAYVNPVVAVLLGWLLLGESVSGRTLVGGALVLVAVIVIVRGRER